MTAARYPRNMKVLSPTEGRFLKLLSDGRPHSREEFLRVLDNPEAGYGAVRIQIFFLRLKLQHRGDGLTVRSERVYTTTYYRLVRPAPRHDE